jgi:hypothetical protein
VILNIGNLCVPCVSRTPVHRVPPHFLFTVMLKAVFGARRIEAVLTLRLRSFLSHAQVLHM